MDSDISTNTTIILWEIERMHPKKPLFFWEIFHIYIFGLWIIQYYTLLYLLFSLYTYYFMRDWENAPNKPLFLRDFPYLHTILLRIHVFYLFIPIILWEIERMHPTNLSFWEICTYPEMSRILIFRFARWQLVRSGALIPNP